MEVAFYNESKSSLLREIEIYHAFVFSLFADTIYLRCHNSTLYNLHTGDHHWSDQKLRELFDLFENHAKDKPPIERSQIELILTSMAKLNKIKHKNKTEIGLLQQGIGFKKTLKDYLEISLEEMLADNRVLGLQSVIGKKVVLMNEMLSICPDKQENLYIREFLNVFRNNKDYQVFGESVYNIFRMLAFNAAQSKLLPRWVKKRFDSIAVEILDFPLVSELSPEQLLYLREQLFPEFGEFRNRLNEFRKAINGIKFTAENFTVVAELFHQQLGRLRHDLQQKVDQQLYIQFVRNNFKDFGLKLFIVIAPVSKMIDYYSKTGIVKPEVTEAVKRNVSREMDLNRCDLYFYVSPTDNLKRRNKRKPSHNNSP
ncbi:MAG: hypothetical protein FJY07_05415 [Bacteroidetes bacterium]|nr:hypothetical protein [Bacteroidota bacterium]